MSDLDLLQRLLQARAPGGEESEVRAICHAEISKHCDEVRIDDAGNLIGVIHPPARPDALETAPVLILAHLDEIAMVVKRIQRDGTLEVTALGGINPVNFGMCPLDVMGDRQTVAGVLSFGSMHLTSQSPQGSDVQNGTVGWKDVHVVTRRSADELERLGVRPGTRAVLSQHWRKPFALGDATAAHFMDDRAPIAAVIETIERVAQQRADLKEDVYFVFTTMEEETNAGALFAAHHLPCKTAIAVEVGPIADEYGTQLAVDPIIVAGDEKGQYTRALTDALIESARAVELQPQIALLVDFASDASAILSAGAMGKAACIAIPTENTHGFEIVLNDAISACASTLTEFLTGKAGAARPTRF